jgi:hypothetical protein
MRGNAHVRFGGRPGETDRPRSRHRAPGPPNHVSVRLGEDDRLCLLVVIGVREDGVKELLAVEDGYRESWRLLERGAA